MFSVDENGEDQDSLEEEISHTGTEAMMTSNGQALSIQITQKVHKSRNSAIQEVSDAALDEASRDGLSSSQMFLSRTKRIIWLLLGK